MKKILLSVSLICITLISVAQNVGIGTSTPDQSALLELNSSSKGFLPPSVALTATNVISPIYNPPATGLLVYNTATTGVAPNNVVPGYYYWNGTVWYPVVNKGTSVGDMQYWDGTKWVMIPIGANGSFLTICNGIPTWNGCSVTLSPSNNPFEGNINPYYPNQFDPQNSVMIEAWTSGGAFTSRALIKFDYSSVPAGATIDSAVLYLYAKMPPGNGNGVDAMYGPTNSYYVQRITSAWTTGNQYTWTSPPTVTATNQATVPQSTSNDQDAAITVTQLVKDMITNGNNGFYMKLVNEVIYNSRIYWTSFAVDPNKHPRLFIKYH